MNDLIQRIANAVIRQEGQPLDAFNAGDLRGAPWLPAHEVVITNGFWRPCSRAQGVAGLAHVIALHIAEGNSLTDFIAGHPGVYSGFAPGADKNDPVAYIRDVCAWAEVSDATVPLWNFIESI